MPTLMGEGLAGGLAGGARQTYTGDGMKISDAALEQLKAIEGYHRELRDGSGRCQAYRCVVGKDKNGQPIHDNKWTIGWGCTEGVTEGMIWTREEAEVALRAELEKWERLVARLVTVDLNQHQFEALVLFAFNVGEGGWKNPKTGKITQGFKTSTLLRKVNAGDFEGAADEFGRWTGSNGVKQVPGLVRRRRLEAALFMTPVDGEEATEPDMPQTIEAPLPISWGEAHSMLKEVSTTYNANRWMVKGIGISVPPGLYWAWDHAVELACGALLCVIFLIYLQHVSRTFLAKDTS